jgi:hypothetical protein
VFRCQATVDLTDITTGAFDRPSVAWPTFTPGERAEGLMPNGLRALVFQHCEFALPSNAGPSLDGWFLLPHRPPTGWPMLLTRGDGRTLLVAPLGAFHEQIIGLNGGTLRCGWHGDLERVSAGFTTDLAVLAADGPRAALDAWGRMPLYVRVVGPTRLARVLRIGPTTARPIGTRPSPDTTSPDRSSPPSRTCGRRASRSVRCSSIRGSTHMLS